MFAPESLRMELIELSEDLILKSQFNYIALVGFYKLYLLDLPTFTRKTIIQYIRVGKHFSGSRKNVYKND